MRLINSPNYNLGKDTCQKAAEVGNCQNYEARWYWDTKEDRCRQFYYGGCGGNDNNFVDESACLARCEKPVVTERPPPPPRRQPEPERPEQPQQPDDSSEPFRSEHCFLPTETGPCRAIVPRFYYNSHEGTCSVFAYGGCQGNQNNFGSEEECLSNCGHVQEACDLPPVEGQCGGNETRWYYDRRSDECAQFHYSGCRGNKNNFYTEDECRRDCQQRRQPPTRSPPQIDSVSIGCGNIFFYKINHLGCRFTENR